ncbi:hypothetical protein ACKVV1_003415 [Pyricularia oryzae]
MVGRIVDKIQLLGSDNRSLINAQTVEGIMKRSDFRTFGQNLQLLLQQKYQWLEECIAIAAKTISREDAEEAFKNALLSDKMVNEEAPQNLAVARRKFSTCMRLMKEEACSGQLWFLAALNRLSLESGYLLENMISDKLQRRFGGTEGRRIGWLPPVAEERDFICIFDGMELPYVIRPAGNGRYLLVGDCIIMGLMMGEGMQLPKTESQCHESDPKETRLQYRGDSIRRSKAKCKKEERHAVPIAYTRLSEQITNLPWRLIT